MFTPIRKLPDGVVGFEARGRVSNADRLALLTPTFDAVRQSGSKVKLLYVTAGDFIGYDPGALLDDVVFGTRHFTDFDRIAFVSDEGPYARAVDALDGLMPAALRRFARNDLDRAKDWLAA